MSDMAVGIIFICVLMGGFLLFTHFVIWQPAIDACQSFGYSEAMNAGLNPISCWGIVNGEAKTIQLFHENGKYYMVSQK